MRSYLLAFVLLFSGCGKPDPIPDWEAMLLRPDGKVHRVWIVSSPMQPVSYGQWNGMVRIYTDRGYGPPHHQYKDTGLVAPVGWYWDIKESE